MVNHWQYLSPLVGRHWLHQQLQRIVWEPGGPVNTIVYL